MIRPLRFLVFFIIFPMLGCASMGKRSTQYKIAKAEDCREFDKIIRTGAKKSRHAKLYKTLRKIAHCETGNKCTGKIDSPNGLYHGAFQYAYETWESVCLPYFEDRKLPYCKKSDSYYEVSCAAMCAAEMISHGGIGNWPTCGM